MMGGTITRSIVAAKLRMNVIATIKTNLFIRRFTTEILKNIRALTWQTGHVPAPLARLTTTLDTNRPRGATYNGITVWAARRRCGTIRTFSGEGRSGLDRQNGKQNRTTDHFERIPSPHRNRKLTRDLVKECTHRLFIAFGAIDWGFYPLSICLRVRVSELATNELLFVTICLHKCTARLRHGALARNLARGARPGGGYSSSDHRARTRNAAQHAPWSG
jgi:hypothetical protein